jgi:dynein heavy chain
LLLQARDNVKFLTTLERHFRSVSSGPLAGILDTLPPLMNALRMVWIISRHYSDDARMGALFARIATELCDRVDGAVLLHQLFRMPAADAIDLLRVSKAVLESWQSTYMQVGLMQGCVRPQASIQCVLQGHLHFTRLQLIVARSAQCCGVST